MRYQTRTTVWTLVMFLRITIASTSPQHQQRQQQQRRPQHQDDNITGYNLSHVTIGRVTDDLDTSGGDNIDRQTYVDVNQTDYHEHGRKRPNNRTMYAQDDDSIMRRVLSDAIEYGIRMMQDLIMVKEPKLYSMGLYLNENDPAYKVASFGTPQKAALIQSKYGYAAIQAKLHLMERLTESRQNPDHDIFKRATIFDEQCPLRGVPRCTSASKRYRTSDGTCNNPDQPWKGASMLPLQRFLQPHYEDGVQSIRRSISGAILPSARDISVIVHRDRDTEMDTVTMMFVQWGQFIDHDITSTAQSRSFEESVPRCCANNGQDFLPPELEHPSCLPISVSSEDPFFSRFGLRCMEFIRSAPSSRINCKLSWREQINQVTSYIDASTVYGSDTQKADSMRTFQNGLLRYGRTGQLNPPDPPSGELCRLGAISTQCFIGGDARVGEQPAVTAFHIVLLRYHNRVAATMAGINRHWSDEKVFQETRRIIGAIIQHITFREFLPIVLGQEVMELFGLSLVRKGYYTGYDSNVNVAPANAFSTAAFRFGHSLVQRSFMRTDRNHRRLFNNVSLHDESSNVDNIFSFASIDRLLLGLSNQPCQRRDEFISSELTNHLFQTSGSPFGMDLAAINIQRGRDHGLPSYTAWRIPCDLAPVRSWRDLEAIMTIETIQRFKSLYEHVEDIDLYSGGLAERPVRGGLVGPTFACIIAQQFMNLRRGDRFWYENGNFESSFTPAQLQAIRRISFAEILCQTLPDVETIQPFVFLTPDNFRNARVLCSSPDMNTFALDSFTEKLTFNRPLTEFSNFNNNFNNNNENSNNFHVNTNFIDRLDVSASSFEPFNRFRPTKQDIPTLNVNHKLDLDDEQTLIIVNHKLDLEDKEIPLNAHHNINFKEQATATNINHKLDFDDNDKPTLSANHKIQVTSDKIPPNISDKLDLNGNDDSITTKELNVALTSPIKGNDFLGFNFTTTTIKTNVNDNLDFDKDEDMQTIRLNQQLKLDTTTKVTIRDILDLDTDVVFLSPPSTIRTKKDTETIDRIFDRRKRDIIYYDDDEETDTADDYLDIIVEDRKKNDNKKKKIQSTTRRPIHKHKGEKSKDAYEAPIKIQITNITTASISIDDNFNLNEYDQQTRLKYRPQLTVNRLSTPKPPKYGFYQNNKFYGTSDTYGNNDQFVLHPTYGNTLNNNNKDVTHLIGTVNRQPSTPKPKYPSHVNINIQYVHSTTTKPPRLQTAYPIRPNNWNYVTKRPQTINTASSRPIQRPQTTNTASSGPILVQDFSYGQQTNRPTKPLAVEIFHNTDYHRPTQSTTTKRPYGYLDELYPQTNKIPYRRPVISYFDQEPTRPHRPQPNIPGHVFTNNQYDYTSSTTTRRPSNNYYYTHDSNNDAVILANKPTPTVFSYDVPVLISHVNGPSSSSFSNSPFSTSKRPYIYRPSSSYYSMFQDIYSTTTTRPTRPKPLYVNSYVERVATKRPIMPNFQFFNSDSKYKDSDPIQDIYAQILNDDKKNLADIERLDVTKLDHKVYYIGNKPYEVPINDKLDLINDKYTDQGGNNFVKISSIRGDKLYNLHNKDTIVNVAQQKEGDLDLILDDFIERSAINDHIDFGLEDKVQIDVIPKESRDNSWHIYEELENVTLPMKMEILYCKDKDSCTEEVPKPMTISDKLLLFET